MNALLGVHIDEIVHQLSKIACNRVAEFIQIKEDKEVKTVVKSPNYAVLDLHL